RPTIPQGSGILVPKLRLGTDGSRNSVSSSEQPRNGVSQDVRSQTEFGNEIDAFILAKLKEKNLDPSPEADKARLLRRLSLDLIGLPPTPEELRAFLADPDLRAYEKQVDRLL